MPNPYTLNWHFPITRGGDAGARLAGQDGTGVIFEWYGESGGQLKYYPPASGAEWVSKVFQLEPLGDAEYGILKKAAAYFPEKWSAAVK